MVKQNRLVHAFFVFPVILAGFLAFLFALGLGGNLTEDTTAITNAAFAILGSMSALSFEYASTIEDDRELKDHITFAAERFLHAALLLILGSVVKYGVIYFVGLEVDTWRSIVRFTGGLIVFFLFSQAMLIGHAGFRILNRHLVDRMARKEDWDDIV